MIIRRGYIDFGRLFGFLDPKRIYGVVTSKDSERIIFKLFILGVLLLIISLSEATSFVGIELIANTAIPPTIITAMIPRITNLFNILNQICLPINLTR